MRFWKDSALFIQSQLTFIRGKIFNSSYRESDLHKFGDRHILRGARNKSACFNKLQVLKRFRI